MTAEPLIAIVEDDGSLRIALIGLLRSSGSNACGFASAEEFLQWDLLRHSNCVITDIQLPGMSGIDLKFELVARQFLVPVIMITARGDPGLEQAAISSGAVSFLKKPFDGNVLIKSLKKALEGNGTQSV